MESPPLRLARRFRFGTSKSLGGRSNDSYRKDARGEGEMLLTGLHRDGSRSDLRYDRDRERSR